MHEPRLRVCCKTPMIKISLFDGIRPEAQTLELELPQFYDLFRQRESVPDRLRSPGWSPCAYKDNHRKHENALVAYALVYDLDKKGITELPTFKYQYVVHTTWRSKPDELRLRVIFPLSRPVDAIEWKKLWHQHKDLMPIKPDESKIHPGSLFFLPACEPGKEAEAQCVIQSDGPMLGVFAGVDLNRVKSQAMQGSGEAFIQQELEKIRTADMKSSTVNAMANAIAAEYVRCGRSDFETIWPLCEQALRENTVSAPVEDWRRAAKDVENGIRNGRASAEREIDELVETKAIAATIEITDKLQTAAEKELRKRLKEVKDGGDVGKAAFSLGRFAHVLGEAEIRAALWKTWKESKKQIGAASDVETLITTGIASGSARPRGVVGGWRQKLRMTGDQAGFAPSEINAHIVLDTHPDMEGVLGHNVRFMEEVLLAAPPWETSATEYPCPLPESDKSRIALWVAEELNVSAIGAKMALEATIDIAKENAFDPFMDYLEKLHKREGVELLDTLLTRGVGAEDTNYTRCVARYWMVSAVARTYKPGSQVDSALILVGQQGKRKSMFFSKVLPEIPGLFADKIPDIHDKDVNVELHKYVFAEMAELSTLTKKAAEDVKQFVTGRSSATRTAYARLAKQFPRRAVLCGTTNLFQDFLLDPTGARRFWPVEVTEIDIDWLVANRDALWAEALWWYQQGKPWWMSPAEEQEAAIKQADATERDMYYEDVESLLRDVVHGWRQPGDKLAEENSPELLKGQRNPEGKLLWVTMKQVIEALALDPRDRRSEYRVKNILQMLGCRARRERVGDRQIRIWYLAV